jgi:hypothetical protein
MQRITVSSQASFIDRSKPSMGGRVWPAAALAPRRRREPVKLHLRWPLKATVVTGFDTRSGARVSIQTAGPRGPDARCTGRAGPIEGRAAGDAGTASTSAADRQLQIVSCRSAGGRQTLRPRPAGFTPDAGGRFSAGGLVSARDRG